MSTEILKAFNHTKGPLQVRMADSWPFDIETVDREGNVVFARQLPCYGTHQQSAEDAMSGKGIPEEWNAAEINSRAYADEVLRAQAPAMLMALELISLGLARIERSGQLQEFCFNGLRYILNGNWTDLINVIGWDKVQKEVGS